MAHNWERRIRATRAAQLQALAFAAAATKLAPDLPAPVDFRFIDSEAVRAFRSTWKPRYSTPPAYGEWDWENEIPQRFSRDPDAFRLAIWSDDELCGLAVGTVTRRGVVISFVAGSPDPNHPLRGSILAAAIAAADAYARGLGLRRLFIAEPAKALLPKYKALGFEVAKYANGSTYCVRTL